MAKKQPKQGPQEREVSEEDLAAIEELTDALGPVPGDQEELAPELDEAGTEDSLETDSLKEQLATSQDEARTNHELYVRTLAEMDNLRKRTQREKEDIAKFSNETILREILPVIDNLERAVEHATEGDNGGGLVEGVEMTLGQFSKVLEKFGVEEIISMGMPFDPAHHQAMGQMETEEFPVNTVAQEMQKGYLLNDRLLRPALVMVAKAPAAPEEVAEGNEED